MHTDAVARETHVIRHGGTGEFPASRYGVPAHFRIGVHELACAVIGLAVEVRLFVRHLFDDFEVTRGSGELVNPAGHSGPADFFVS